MWSDHSALSPRGNVLKGLCPLGRVYGGIKIPSDVWTRERLGLVCSVQILTYATLSQIHHKTIRVYQVYDCRCDLPRLFGRRIGRFAWGCYSRLGTRIWPEMIRGCIIYRQKCILELPFARKYNMIRFVFKGLVRVLCISESYGYCIYKILRWILKWCKLAYQIDSSFLSTWIR